MRQMPGTRTTNDSDRAASDDGARVRRTPMWLVLFAPAAGVIACNAFNGIEDFEVAQRRLDPDDASANEIRDADPTNDDAPNDGDDDAATVPDTSIDDTGALDASTPTSKRVFVTSDQFMGDIGGLAGGDAKCAAAAARGGLDGQWISWLSAGTTNAIDRVGHDGRYVLLDGREVVANKVQLSSGALSTPIDLTEMRNIVSGAADVLRVWTGTEVSGLRSEVDRCVDFTTSSSIQWGVMGNTSKATRAWTQAPGAVEADGGWGCQTKGHLYCFEQ